MPLELGVWRIDGRVERVEFTSLDQESRLEDMLEQNVGIANENLMIVGRQVKTSFDKYIELLAIDRDGNLVILELKRDKTYRDIVAQVLDYGSWVSSLRSDQIAQIFDAYLEKHHPDRTKDSIDRAFCGHFGVAEMPEELNDTHELVIVASSLDPSTERIVRYLAEHYEVRINVLFFRVFRDDDREYLARAWLSDPDIGPGPGPGPGPSRDTWNGEYYVSYNASRNPGRGRNWDDAVRYGFIGGGGGSFYSKTLGLLEPGGRVWVNVPGGTGYVGVGTVVSPTVKIDQFMVKNEAGEEVPITEARLNNKNILRHIDDPEKAEYLVRIEWIKTVPLDQAIKEKGFFGNQNTVAKPKVEKWRHTVERLKKRFAIE